MSEGDGARKRTMTANPTGAVVKVESSDEYFERTVEQAVASAVIQAAGPSRRRFLASMGAAALTALVAELLPLKEFAAFAADPVGKPEKTDLRIGFIPITCATPIIMAEPLGFYSKHGLNAKVKRAAGWAMVRDWAINKDVDAAHMLSPMPLAITLGAGSVPVPFYMPAVENINGQAITLHNKHKGVKTAADMKGFRFCVPFDYSMHNYLLRYFLAEGGVHPDKDVHRVIERHTETKSLHVGGSLHTLVLVMQRDRLPVNILHCRHIERHRDRAGA